MFGLLHCTLSPQRLLMSWMQTSPRDVSWSLQWIMSRYIPDFYRRMLYYRSCSRPQNHFDIHNLKVSHIVCTHSQYESLCWAPPCHLYYISNQHSGQLHGMPTVWLTRHILSQYNGIQKKAQVLLHRPLHWQKILKQHQSPWQTSSTHRIVAIGIGNFRN